MSREIVDTGFRSCAVGDLAEGCRLCVKGEKEVVFITGICPRKPSCFYCPVSDEKKGKDVVYANEWPVDDLKDIVTEAKLCDSKGAGITGGDPLSRLDRTVKVIRLLKERFGKTFHIHLYTPLDLVDAKKIKKLEDAGLDEIRFHPKVDDDSDWERILVKTSMSKGVEIPVVPGQEENIMRLARFIDRKVGFLNLNELEVSDTNANKIYEMGFRTKDDVSYAVGGSFDAAMRILEYCRDFTSLNVHLCTVSLKDGVQLPNRIMRRAKNVARPFDRVTDESTLVRAAVYLPELSPGFGYLRRVKAVREKDKVVKKLKELKKELVRKLSVSPRMFSVDGVKLRILTSVGIAKKNKDKIKRMGLSLEIVEELPTYDEFEIESESL